jgi:diguanylate cyclase (GGDEF)-like protein/PAS domain S-box-containing protein
MDKNQLSDAAVVDAARQWGSTMTADIWRYIFDAVETPIFLHDQDFRLLLVNRAYCKEAGKTEAEILGKPYWQVFPVRDGPLPGCKAAVNKVVHDGSHEEFIVGERHFLSMGYPVVGDNNEFHYSMHLLSDITQRKQTEEKIKWFAFYDVLTELPNRRLLSDRLTQAMSSSKRNEQYGALMFLDLDNFKPLNDEHGHAVGDLLLMEVASRLKKCVRDIDTVARLGGDEFVVMLTGLDKDKDVSTEQARQVAEKIRRSLAEPYFLESRADVHIDAMVEHHCSASIGAVLFFDHECSQDEVMRRADAAMYKAKEMGRNRVAFYAPGD